MIAGTLNESINIYTPIVTVNEYGEQTTEFELKYITRARVLENGGSRQLSNNEIVYPYQKSFLVRDYIEITDFDKIQWNGKYYKVLDITPNKKRMELEVRTELIND